MSSILSGDTVALVDGNYLRHQLGAKWEYGWTETLKLDFKKFREWMFDLDSSVEDGSYYFDGEPHYDPKLPASQISEGEEWVRVQKNRLLAWGKSGFHLRLGEMVWRDVRCRHAGEQGHPITCSHREPKQKNVDPQILRCIADTIQYRPQVRRFILVAGDHDHLTAVQYARDAGRVVTLIHGSYDVARELQDEADVTYELSRPRLLRAPFATIINSYVQRPSGPRWI